MIESLKRHGFAIIIVHFVTENNMATQNDVQFILVGNKKVLYAYTFEYISILARMYEFILLIIISVLFLCLIFCYSKRLRFSSCISSLYK